MFLVANTEPSWRPDCLLIENKLYQRATKEVTSFQEERVFKKGFKHYIHIIRYIIFQIGTYFSTITFTLSRMTVDPFKVEFPNLASLDEQINNFRGIEQEVSHFRVDYHNFCETNGNMVVDLSYAYRQDLKMLNSRYKELERQSDELSKQEMSLKETLEILANTSKKTIDQINKLTLRKEELESKKLSLQNEIQQFNHILNKRQTQLNEKKRFLAEQSKIDKTKLEVIKKLLGLHIETDKKNELTFVFMLKNTNNQPVRCFVTLDVSSPQKGFKLLKLSETSESFVSRVENIIADFNKSNNLPLMIVQLRKHFMTEGLQM